MIEEIIIAIIIALFLLPIIAIYIKYKLSKKSTLKNKVLALLGSILFVLVFNYIAQYIYIPVAFDYYNSMPVNPGGSWDIGLTYLPIMITIYNLLITIIIWLLFIIKKS